ncbi:MAG: 2-oxoacid:acceptor oxidoreductase family protein [Planctomycetota bacterium]|jgi:2-oxoglutarate ferredoxin oxidoreductase subunit gamma
MARNEIQITGLGGQGVILLGYVLGKTAALYGDSHAAMTQSFGPEARGSACSSQVVIDKERIAYPYAIQPEFLIAMSQDGYEKFVPKCGKDAVIFIDEELITPKTKHKHLGIPATRIAEEVGRRILLNIVMLGHFGRHSGLFPQEAFQKAVEASVPKGTEEMNLKAFQRGWEAMP